MNTMHLIGAEQVERAGVEIRGAAESFALNVGFLGELQARFIAALDEHAARFEAATTQEAELQSVAGKNDLKVILSIPVQLLISDILSDLSSVAGAWVVEASGAGADARNHCAMQMHEAIERWTNSLGLAGAAP